VERVGLDGQARTLTSGVIKMNTSKHCKIIKDMDEKIMNGERACADFIILLTALRDLVDQSHDYDRKMSDRVNAMKTQVDEWRDRASDLEEALEKEKGVRQLAQRHYKESVNVANRRAGIWKAKVERLKMQGTN
jgi:hypothetical protein